MQTLIRTARLIDGTGAPEKQDWSLLVRDGLIVDSGPSAQFDGLNAETLDLTGGVVIPGFLDVHTHFCWIDEAGFQQYAAQPNKVAMLAAGFANAEEWLHQGVTTTRIVGTPFDLDIELRLGSPARRIDLERRLVVVGEEEVGYDALLLATGSRARRLGILDRSALPVSSLVDTLFAHARQGRHGIRKLRAVLDRHLEREEVTDSDFELLVLSLLAEHGFPPPVLHHEIRVGDVLIAEVDLAWPDRCVAAELHGRVHLQPEVWERDQVKAVELDALGWTLLPFTWRAYRDRRPWMLDRLRRALAD